MTFRLAARLYGIGERFVGKAMAVRASHDVSQIAASQKQPKPPKPPKPPKQPKPPKPKVTMAQKRQTQAIALRQLRQTPQGRMQLQRYIRANKTKKGSIVSAVKKTSRRV